MFRCVLGCLGLGLFFGLLGFGFVFWVCLGLVLVLFVCFCFETKKHGVLFDMFSCGLFVFGLFGSLWF